MAEEDDLWEDGDHDEGKEEEDADILCVCVHLENWTYLHFSPGQSLKLKQESLLELKPEQIP